MSSHRSIKGEMKNVIPDPPVAWNPDDIAGWRTEQFTKMGFTGDLLEFLANSGMDLRKIEILIERGATPLEAVRIEAGKDFVADDPHFNHELFDILITPVISEPTIPEDWEEEKPEERPFVGGTLS